MAANTILPRASRYGLMHDDDGVHLVVFWLQEDLPENQFGPMAGKRAYTSWRSLDFQPHGLRPQESFRALVERNRHLLAFDHDPE